MLSKKFKVFSSAVLSLVLCAAIFLTTMLPPISASAVSGSFTGGEVNRGYRLKITYSESAQNPKTNKSKVTATLYLVQDSTYSLYISTRSATITINGTKTTISDIPAIRNSGGVTTKLGSASKTITHTSDGSKSISIKGTFDMNATLSGTYYGTMSTSKTISLDKLDRTAPEVNLAFVSSTVNSVKLKATSNVTCDNWQYSTNGGDTWKSFGSEGKSNTFTISNLSGGKTYSVIARARKTKNNITSANSSTVKATTKPSPPGSLKLSSATQTSATVTWGAVTGAKSYKVYLGSTLKASGLTTRSYTFTGLTANTKYTFGVSATGTAGDSSTATSSLITLPNTPTGLKVTSKTDKKVVLSWSYNAGGGDATTTFAIYKGSTQIGSTTASSCTDNSYDNTNCTYSVQAVTSAGSSAKSTAVSVTYVPLSISLNAVNNSTYATITPTFSGGYNRSIDYNSFKWAYGSQSAAYFADNGYSFVNDFTVIKNGTYTVFAKDTSGNSAIKTITISGIYTDESLGAFVQTFTDLSVDSIGLPISFERTYNSMDTTSNIFGNGWSLNYAKRTQLSADGTVRLVYLPDGTVNYFSVTENGFVGLRTQNTLVANENALVLTTKDRIKYTYENGYLTRIEDANGNATIITLNEQNQPVTITDSVGRVYTITYTNNKISGITDPAGRLFSYVYDENGNLSEHRQGTETIVNKFEYSGGLLTNILDDSDNTVYEVGYMNLNQVASVKDDEGNTTYYLYSIASNGELTVYESENMLKFDENGNVIELDENGDEITYTEESEDSTSDETIEETNEEETEEQQILFSIYNSFGQIISDLDNLAYEYNTDGTVSKIDGEFSDKTLVVYTYNEHGDVLSIITNEVTVDEITKEITSCKIIEEDTYSYTYFENTDHISSVIETITTYIYDEEGDANEPETQTETEADTDPEPKTDIQIFTTTYDDKGNLLTETTNDNGEEKTFSYTYYGNGLINSETENGLTSTYIYDSIGTVIKTTQSDGTDTRITRIVYDDKYRVIQKIDTQQYNSADDGLTPNENGICSTNVYNNKNVGERYTYDDNNDNVLTYINKANNKTVNTYDTENRLVKTVTYENASTTANGLTTRYVYDSEGNLIKTVYPHQYNAANDNLDARNGVNEYTDDTVGERVTYDENGNVSTYIDSFGKETVNTYDNNGNLVKSVTGNETTRFVYNGGDNLLQVIYPDQYNPDDDNLDLETETPVDTYENEYIGDRYEYDKNGNVTTYTNIYGEVTTNNYDSEGNLISITKPDNTVFTFDGEGRANNETYSNSFVRDFTYSDNQTVISSFGGEYTATYNMNAFGEVIEYKLKNGENNKDYFYTYDSNGNITSISLNGDLKQTFTYNSSNELVRVDDAVMNKTITYGYDYVGNITAVKTYDYTTGELGTPEKTEIYNYNSQNQRTDLSYDAYGNLNALNDFSFTWDGRRLAAAVNDDTETNTNTNISYTYNHNGIRTSKTINGITTYYIVDENNNIVKQYELVNDVETNVVEFVYDNDGAPIYIVYNGTVYYYEKNLQGDIVSILDSDRNTVVEYTYDIWGKLLGISGTLADTLGVSNPLRYRGYYYDTETSLYYLQSRYYSPDLMRFISQDDAVLSNAQGEPIGSNLYVYCNNEPVRYKDPTGHIAIVDDLTFLGIAMITTMVLAVATSYMSTPQFRQSWNSFTSAVSGGLSWLWNRITVLFQSATTVVTKAVEKNIAKAKTIILAKRYQDYYWIASKVTFKRKNVSRTTYFPCMPIPKAAAIAYVRSGGDVFASSSVSARRLAIAINGSPPVGPEKHGSGLGYFYHYHARKRIGAGRGGGHIFYLW